MQSPRSGDRQADAARLLAPARVQNRPRMSAQVPSGRLTSDDADSRSPTVAAMLDQMVTLTSDRRLWALVGRYSQCADSTLDPDDWFPVSAEAETARREAGAAIDLCQGCLVRSQCLELSLRHWDIGQHGVWGGMVAADRAELRTRLPFASWQASGSHWSFGGAGGPQIPSAAS
jgi:hypothetical protein